MAKQDEIGTLVDCLVLAQRKAERLHKKTKRFVRKYNKARAALEAHSRALATAEGFVVVAAKDLLQQTALVANCDRGREISIGGIKD